ncbi:uncharacterized protein SOCE836_039420 [Sorangium cellulosum]|uniref:Uncharacterized protein n=1 Tax=Sorangium cellulosum TaxID=56 RepID=A0A4P2QNW6_SORCE|nr:uncharacterized protein SOCE836_039420 [Sorangium cellulosum]WCQ91185.1 hypothetical protein NQZ70_03900 [Sorangium sp. Soce836]
MVDPSPRDAVVASLAETLTRAVTLGDEEAARAPSPAATRPSAAPARTIAPEGCDPSSPRFPGAGFGDVVPTAGDTMTRARIS